MGLYNAHDFTAVMAVNEYITRFRNVEATMAACRHCSGYGCSWGCPPFDYNIEELLRRYNNVLLIATRITPVLTPDSMAQYEEILHEVRESVTTRLLNLEHETEGLACTYMCRCTYCGSMPCARIEGKPCRHPQRIRPSLEAYGFDIVNTLKHIFGIDLQWSVNGSIPSYMVIVSALFFNGEKPIW